MNLVLGDAYEELTGETSNRIGMVVRNHKHGIFFILSMCFMFCCRLSCELSGFVKYQFTLLSPFYFVLYYLSAILDGTRLVPHRSVISMVTSITSATYRR